MITEQAIKDMLKTNNNGFCTIEYVSKIPGAAAYKNILLQKHCRAQVQLFSTETAYETAVKKNTTHGDSSDFKKGKAHFVHEPDCYSIVKSGSNTMLYCRFIRVLETEYLVNGNLCSKENFSCYLTPSAAKKLLDGSDTTYNATHDIEHKVVLRTVGLGSLRRIAACGEVLGESIAFGAGVGI